MAFSTLLRHLEPSIPVYGLQSRGLRSEAALPRSVEDIAVDYLEQIRRIQTRGPYRLVGRSVGGLIAYALAEQLRARGERVQLLAMIDTFLFTTGPASHVRSESDEVQAALDFLDIAISAEQPPRTLPELVAYLMHPDRVGAIPFVHGAVSLVREMDKIYPGFVKRLCIVTLNNVRLAQRYLPAKLDIDLVYFRATQATGNLEGILDRDPYVWERLVKGRVEVHDLVCHHEAVLDPVPAAQIAKVLHRQLLLSNEVVGRNAPLEAERKAAHYA